MNKEFLIKLGLTLLEIALFVLIAAAVILGFTAIFNVFGLSANSPASDPYWQLVIEYLPQNIAFLSAYFIIRKFIFKRSFAELGLVKENLLPHLGKGFLESAVVITVGVLLLFVVQRLDFSSVQWDFHLFSGLLILFFFQSLSEEIMTRGFLLGTLAHRFGNVPALLISSFLFSLLHYFNPDFTLMGGLNILLAGLVLGLMYIRYQNLWVCTGFHWGWNFVQSAFYDFNVSGFDVASLIRFKSLPPAWLSGGTFGFEGSAVSVVLLSVFCVYYFRKTQLG